jgi:predicted TIM-barrel fold metal-dependent hydrolase
MKGIFEAKIEEFIQFPNAYFDTAMINHAGVLKYTFDHFPSERILFGSDFPVISSGMYVAGVLFEHLTPAEQKMVFRDNFLRLSGYEL